MKFQSRRKRLHWTLVIAVLLFSAIFPVKPAVAEGLPEEIPLPAGFQPEGITFGIGPNFYVGSIPSGAIFHGNLRSGKGELLVEPQEGRMAIGLAFDRRSRYLYAAGGPTGKGFVYDARSGETVAILDLTDPGSFINDVVVTRRAAYFTDSSRPVLYRVPLLEAGKLPDPPVVEEIQLSGDYVFVPEEFNANGIEATRNGKWLVIVHSFRGELYRVDPHTGQATLIDLNGGSVQNGDGLLLHRGKLFVVQNFLNQIAVVRLNDPLTSGRIVRTVTDPDFSIPTTIDNFRNALYVVNARFDTPPTPETEYEVVRVNGR
jgi:hypothetical protein